MGNCQVNLITHYQICAIALGQYKVFVKIATVLRNFYISQILNPPAIRISPN